MRSEFPFFFLLCLILLVACVVFLLLLPALAKEKAASSRAYGMLSVKEYPARRISDSFVHSRTAISWYCPEGSEDR